MTRTRGSEVGQTGIGKVELESTTVLDGQIDGYGAIEIGLQSIKREELAHHPSIKLIDDAK